MTINDMIMGLSILSKYADKQKESSVEANHDLIMAEPSITENHITDSADRFILEEQYGWFFNKEHGCWCHFT
jgi:hypothetical protein